MTNLKWIDPSRIQKNWELNPRERDAAHIQNLAKHMNSGGYDKDFPIIVYNLEDSTWELPFAATGFHRLEAAMLKSDEFPHLPLKRVYAEVRDGTIDDLVKTMMLDNFRWDPGVNRRLGKMPTRNEVRAMRHRLLFIPSEFEKGDRMLASEWGCDHKTIGGLRDKLIEEVQGGDFSPPQFVNDTDISDILKIHESDMYLALDGNKHPRRKRNGSDPSPQEELPGVPTTEEISDKEKRKGWVALSVKIAHSIIGLELNNLIQTYCIRRLKAPREVRTWEDPDYAKGVDDAKLWLTAFESPQPDGEMTLMLEEIGLINEVLGTYKALMGDQFHIEMLSTEGKDAKKAVMSLRTADFEAMDRSLRMELLGDLKNEFGYVSEFEEKAHAEKERQSEAEKAEKELEEAREEVQASRRAMWNARDETGLTSHSTPDEFQCAALKSLGLSEDARQYMFEVAIRDPLLDLPLSGLRTWRSRFDTLKIGIEQKAEWVKALYPQPDLEGLKAALNDKHWRHEHNWGSLTPADMNALAEKYHCTLADVRQAKKEVALENPPPDWEGLEVAIRSAEISNGTYDLFKLAKKHHMGALESVAVMELQKKIVAELDEEPDHEQIQTEHTDRLKALPGEIRDYIPKWQEAHAIEGEITLKLLVMARWELVHIIERGPNPFFKEEMEDILKRMKANDSALVEKVCELLDGKPDTTITAEGAAQMERDYPPIDDATAEPESDKQDPTYDEWKEKWEPQLIEVFQSHGVEYGSVAIDQGVMKDYEKWPWNLSVEQLERLITESKTIVNHPKIPEIAWKRNRGKEGILWALDVLGLNEDGSAPDSEAGDISDALAVVRFQVASSGKTVMMPGVNITDHTMTEDEFDDLLYSLEEKLKDHLGSIGIVVRDANV